MDNKDICRFPWMKFALREYSLGIREIKGNKHNDRILLYHSTTSLKAKADEVPWCSAFVNYCLSEAGITGTKSAAARSWLKWGQELSIPEYGCICILSRGTNPSEGHVGFYIGEILSDLKSPQKILLLGGNQKDTISIAEYERSRVLSYRGL